MQGMQYFHSGIAVASMQTFQRWLPWWVNHDLQVHGSQTHQIGLTPLEAEECGIAILRLPVLHTEAEERKVDLQLHRGLATWI